MPSYRFPTLIWEDYEGFFTACTLEEHFAAVDRNPKKAAAQIQEYLAWLYQEEPWRTEPEIQNATAQRFKVKIRPEYVEDERVFPSEEVIELDVMGAVAEIRGGTRVCDLPMLGVHFYYYPSTGERTLTAMVSHHVRESLKSLTPGQLSQYLPPRSSELDEVVVRVNKRKKQADWEAFSTLSTVAERLDDPTLRKQFSRAYERDKELQDLQTRLVQERANVLLVGEPGCGKTALVIDTARRLTKRKDLEKLDAERTAERDFLLAMSDLNMVDFAEGLEFLNLWQMWMTSGARLVAGMKYLGQWEERCEAIINELSDSNGILCVESLRELILRGGHGPADSLAAFFLPYLQRGELQMVCEATPAELAACRRWLPGFVEAFQILKLPEFDRVKAIRVLDRIATSHRNSLHIEMEARVIQMVHRLFRRFMPYQAFPGKTANFIREIFEKARKEKKNEVTDQAVVDHF
ncbi:MAG: hypothetical protein QF473_35745, partial [Planctomycetota bacterium]|nr:hypothetical protein [Planctomycetota bacterium]